MGRKLNIPLIFMIIISHALSAQKVPRMNIYKGVAFSEIQAHDSAIYYLGSAGESLNDYQEAYLFYGRSLMAKGQNAIAIQEFLKAEKIEAGLASFWLAKAYARNGEVEKMIEYLEINSKSKYREPENKIILDADFNQYENLDQWKKFWKENTNYSTLDALLIEADYLIRSGEYTDGLVLINDGIKKGLRKTALHAKRAEIYLGMNNYRMAVSDLTTAINGDKRNSDLYFRRASAYMNLKKYKQAVEDYNQVIKLNPLNLKSYKERAAAYNHTGNYEEAIKDISFYLQYYQGDDEGWYQKGMIHFSNQAYLKSLESFSKALVLNNRVAKYYAARGETYLQTKTFRYAWNDFSMALDLSPDNPKYYLGKGIAAYNLGKIDDACYSFEMARRRGAYEAEEYISNYCGVRK